MNEAHANNNNYTNLTYDALKKAFIELENVRRDEPKLVMATGYGGCVNIIERHGIETFLELIDNGNVITFSNECKILIARLKKDKYYYELIKDKLL